MAAMIGLGLQNLQSLPTSLCSFFCRGPGPVLTSLFFGVGENLGNHLVLRIEFSGAFEGIDGLWPLIANSIETTQGKP